MAYITKYEFLFESDNGTTYLIELQKKVAEDSEAVAPKRRALGQAPVLKQEKRGHVFGTSLTMFAECLEDQEFAELYDPDPTAWKVRLTDQDQARLLWEGYLVPELYSEPDIAPPYDVQIIATDGIGELKFHNFDLNHYIYSTPTDRENWGTLLQYIFKTTELGWTSDQDAPSVITPTECHELGQDFEPLIPRAVTNNVHLYDGWNMYDILENILTALNLYVIRHDNRWVFFHVNDFGYYEQYGQIFLRDEYDWDGTFKGRGLGMVAKLEGDWWPVGYLNTAVEPARKSLALQCEYRYRESILESPDFGTRYRPSTGWRSYGQAETYYLNEGFDDQGVYHVEDRGLALGTLNPQLAPFGQVMQEKDIPQITHPLKVTIHACDLHPVYASESYNPTFSVKLRLETPGGQYYELKYVEPGDSAPGGYVWGQTENNEIILTFPRFLHSEEGSQRNVEEFNLVFPPCPAGHLSVYVATEGSPYFFIGYFGIGPTEGVSPKGLKVDVAIQNGARMEAEGVTLDTMTGTKESQTVYDGMLTGRHGDPIDTVRDEVITAQRSAEYLAMDYAREVALPRLRCKGKLNMPKGARLPRIFEKGGNPYLIEESTWDLWADELEVDMVSLPATNPSITQLTVTTLEYR